MADNQTMDSYLASLSSIVTEVEAAYQLQSGNESSVRYADLEIKDLINVLNSRVSALDKVEITNMNTKAGNSLVLLSYVSARLDYFGKKRLDYSKYPGMQCVVEVLLNFTKPERINENVLRSVNAIVELLAEIDERYINYRGGLGYRYLRLFVILILFGNYFNAAVVASFILSQLVVKGVQR